MTNINDRKSEVKASSALIQINELAKIWRDAAKQEELLNNSLKNVFIHDKTFNSLSNLTKTVLEYPSITTKNEDRERLIKKVKELERDLVEKTKSKEEIEIDKAKLIEQLKEIQEKKDLGYILARVGEPIQRRILDNPGYRDNFVHNRECSAYVMSIDIRKSTSLMLKARRPDLFAGFITELCDSLKGIVLDNSGIFDKFTGDGVLAFFPDFLNEDGVSASVLTAVEKCHCEFNVIYKKYRNIFTAVYKDTGLGIGIDYGNVNLVRFGADLSIVGTPVVYACRFSGGSPGNTLCNQAAIDKMITDIPDLINVDEAEIDVKHEGVFNAYRVVRKMCTR